MRGWRVWGLDGEGLEGVGVGRCGGWSVKCCIVRKLEGEGLEGEGLEGEGVGR